MQLISVLLLLSVVLLECQYNVQGESLNATPNMKYFNKSYLLQVGDLSNPSKERKDLCFETYCSFVHQQ